MHENISFLFWVYGRVEHKTTYPECAVVIVSFSLSQSNISWVRSHCCTILIVTKHYLLTMLSSQTPTAGAFLVLLTTVLHTWSNSLASEVKRRQKYLQLPPWQPYLIFTSFTATGLCSSWSDGRMMLSTISKDAISWCITNVSFVTRDSHEIRYYLTRASSQDDLYPARHLSALFDASINVSKLLDASCTQSSDLTFSE